jgi:hypothetical protein
MIIATFKFRNESERSVAMTKARKCCEAHRRLYSGKYSWKFVELPTSSAYIVEVL